MPKAISIGIATLAASAALFARPSAAAQTFFVGTENGIITVPAVPNATPLPYALPGYFDPYVADDSLYLRTAYDVAAIHIGETQPFLSFVAPQRAGSLCGSGKVFYLNAFFQGAYEYEVGTGRLIQFLSDSNGPYFTSCAADAAGDVFLSYLGSGDSSGVDEFAGGNGPPVKLPDSRRDLGGPIALAPNGDLFVATLKGAHVYPRPYTHWTKVFRFSTPAVAYAFTASGTAVWALLDLGQGHVIEERSYPQDQLLGQIILPTGATAIALTPLGPY